MENAGKLAGKIKFVYTLIDPAAPPTAAGAGVVGGSVSMRWTYEFDTVWILVGLLKEFWFLFEIFIITTIREISIYFQLCIEEAYKQKAQCISMQIVA